MSALAKLLGENLLTKGGIVPTDQALAGKSKIGLYFSAHWCPPCRGFTPVAAASYTAIKEAGENGFEIVFVSSDSDQEAFDEYYGEMPWISIPFDKVEDVKDNLDTTFGVRGIPQLSIINSDGSLVTNGGRELIGKYGSKAFPFTPEHLEIVEGEQKKVASSAIQKLADTQLPALLGGSLDAGVETICLILGNPGKDRAVSALAKATPEIEAAHPGKFLVRYVPWADEADEGHKEAASGFTIAPPKSLTAEGRELIQAAACGPIEPPQLLVMGRSKPGEALSLLCADAWQPVVRFGRRAYPFSAGAVASAEAEEKARVAALSALAPRLAYLKTPARDTLQRGVGAAATAEAVDAAADGAELVGLYFSAAWCGPCQRFTPRLRAAYEEHRAAGRRFEVVFISSDSDQEAFDEYFSKMPWLALPFAERELKETLSRVYAVRGIPTLVILDPRDGRVVAADGVEAIGNGAAWPFDEAALAAAAASAAERAQAERAAAAKAEAAAVAAQEAAPAPRAVVRRRRGEPGAAGIDLATRTVTVTGFVTVAVPGCVVPPGGRGYYEVEVTGVDSIVQIGWSTAALKECDTATGEGVGDDAGSWGVDGVRKLKWLEGKTEPYAAEWKVGDVIGLAVAVPSAEGGGSFSVSVNGSFEAPHGELVGAAGLAAAREAGVFPALTSSPGFSYKYNFGTEPFKFAPPSAEYKPVIAFAAA